MNIDFDPKSSGRDAWTKKWGKYSDKPKGSRLKVREYSKYEPDLDLAHFSGRKGNGTNYRRDTNVRVHDYHTDGDSRQIEQKASYEWIASTDCPSDKEHG